MKPIPAIILAQAINGALLPIVAIFLFVAANDKKLLGTQFINKWFSNLLTLVIVGLSCFIGLNNVVKASARTMNLVLGEAYLWVIAIISILVALLLFWVVLLNKRE